MKSESYTLKYSPAAQVVPPCPLQRREKIRKDYEGKAEGVHDRLELMKISLEWGLELKNVNPR